MVSKKEDKQRKKNTKKIKKKIKERKREGQGSFALLRCLKRIWRRSSSSSSQDHWETPFPSWYSSWDLVFPTWIKPGNATNDRLLSDSYNTTLQHSQQYTTFSNSYLRLIYNTLQTFIWDSYIKHFNSYLILIYNTPILIWDSYTTLSNYYYIIYYTIKQIVWFKAVKPTTHFFILWCY